MKKYWFIFCKTDIMLEKAEDSFSIPLSEDCPIPLHPWTHVLNITPMEDGTEVKAVMIDQPVTDYPQYEMCGLRPSFYRLPMNFILKQVNVMSYFTGIIIRDSVVYVERL